MTSKKGYLIGHSYDKTSKIGLIWLFWPFLLSKNVCSSPHYHYLLRGQKPKTPFKRNRGRFTEFFETTKLFASLFIYVYSLYHYYIESADFIGILRQFQRRPKIEILKHGS